VVAYRDLTLFVHKKKGEGQKGKEGFLNRPEMKLPAQRAGLPGKVISFYIVPLPACR
jgi:hypothetical protein